MVEGWDELVEAVRRMGPGVLPLSDLPGELNIRTQTGGWNEARVRRAVVGDPQGRLNVLDLQIDPPSPLDVPVVLGSWVLIATPDDAPDQSWITRAVWDGLDALAKEVDPLSRVGVSRWILKAREATALFSLLHERGPPPTNPHRSSLT